MIYIFQYFLAYWWLPSFLFQAAPEYPVALDSAGAGGSGRAGASGSDRAGAEYGKVDPDAMGRFGGAIGLL